MSKSFREQLDIRIHSVNDAEEQRRLFAQLVEEEQKFGISEFHKGQDIGRHVIYMHQNNEDIVYAPIIEAQEVEGKLVPKDCPINRGLFEALGVEIDGERIQNPNQIVGSFVIPAIGATVVLEDVPTLYDLTPVECEGLGGRVVNYPFLRASYKEV